MTSSSVLEECPLLHFQTHQYLFSLVSTVYVPSSRVLIVDNLELSKGHFHKPQLIKDGQRQIRSASHFQS